MNYATTSFSISSHNDFPNPLRAIIVDDETHGRKNLEYLLTKHCPQIQVTNLTSSIEEAEFSIQGQQPDIVFLDIELSGENGFDLLSLFPERKFSVIFVTAYNHYAIEAIKAHALDYLLKPIDVVELRSSIQKAYQYHQEKNTSHTEHRENTSLQQFLHTHSYQQQKQKITVPHSHGCSVFDTMDIIRLESVHNYVTIHTRQQKPLMVSKILKEFETLLHHQTFVRIHKSHIINIHNIRGYSNEDGGVVTMSDGCTLAIARRRHNDFLYAIKNISSIIR